MLFVKFLLTFFPLCFTFVSCCMPERVFPLYFHALCFRRRAFSYLFAFCGTIFCTYDVRVYTSISPDIYYLRRRTSSTPSTAQYGTAHRSEPAQTSSKSSTRRSECDNAGRQTELAHASAWSSIYKTLCVHKRTKKSKSSRPTKILLAWCEARRVGL